MERDPSTQETDLPLQLVTRAGFAAILGVSRQRGSQLWQEGKLPHPHGLIDGRVPVWTEEQAITFRDVRQGRPPKGTIIIDW